MAMGSSETDRWAWRNEDNILARQLVDQHFAGPQGLSTLFPCMRDSFPWADSRPPVADPRVPAKNHTEYKGLERHANQYHSVAWYDFAHHHWFLAGWWRHADMVAHGFDDHGHREAIRFCLKQSAYNEALWRWQTGGAKGPPPAAEEFDLDSNKVDVLEARAQRELDAVVPKSV